MRQHRDDQVDSSTSSPAHRSDPGKRSLTERLVQRSPAAAPAAAAPASAAASNAEAHEDPYGIHLLGAQAAGKLEPGDLDAIGRALQEVAKGVKEVAGKLGKAEKLAGMAGIATGPMKKLIALLEGIADKVDLAGTIASLVAQTQEWDAAFDAFQADKTPANADRLTAATHAWSETMQGLAGRLPQPMAASIQNGLKGLDVGVEVVAHATAKSLTEVRADEAEYHDGRPPAPGPTAAPRVAASLDNPRGYRVALDEAIDEYKARFDTPFRVIGVNDQETIDEMYLLVDEWDRLAPERGVIDSLVDRFRGGDKHVKEIAAIKAQLNFKASVVNGPKELPRAK